jgi:hypothetical protein
MEKRECREATMWIIGENQTANFHSLSTFTHSPFKIVAYVRDLLPLTSTLVVFTDTLQ